MNPQTIFTFFMLLVLSGCRDQKESKTTITSAETTAPLTQESRETLLKFQTLDQKTILNRLFDNPEFDRLGLAAWKPNYSDQVSLSIPLSYDGKFHTSLDTVLYFNDNQIRNCAVAIFSTYDLQLPDTASMPEPTGCHFCGVPIGAALFFRNKEQQWELYHFQKEFTNIGSFGTYKRHVMGYFSIRLMEVGNRVTALAVTNEPTGNGGFMEGNEMLYAIEQHPPGNGYVPPLKLLFINAYDCSDSFFETHDEPAIQTVKSKSAYFDLLVNTVHNDTSKTATYQFSDEAGSFIVK